MRECLPPAGANYRQALVDANYRQKGQLLPRQPASGQQPAPPPPSGEQLAHPTPLAPPETEVCALMRELLEMF